MESRTPNGVGSVSCLPPEQAAQIRAQLNRLLASQQFRSSRRCQRLLRHVTEHALAGDVTAIKERTLGIEVFGRSADYDTGQDPIVRATAAETRKKLAQYYLENQHDLEPRIDLLAGSYIPEFHLPAPAQPAPASPPKLRAWRRIVILAAIAIVLPLAAFLWFHRHGSSLDQFWAPILDAPGPVLISLGQPVAYNLVSAQAQDQIQATAVGSPPEPGQSRSGTIAMNQLIILRDRYVAVGDAICLARLAAALERHGKEYRIRGERSTSSSDLRENAAVLLGAFDNQWTLRAAGQLRFTFFKDSARETDMVRDRLHPERTEWKLTGAWPHWENLSEDYAIISRLVDANTDRPVVIAAGITHFGTMAAGELISNPEYFSEVAGQLSPGWRRKNLQLVLRVPVVHGAAGHPRVLATHVW
jgi:hypothetical protein